MLNAQWLETFTVLCETGHFTRTADLLGMTQPGVSQHLRKLEEQLGQALISRQGKSFSLTPAGEAVLTVGRARRIEDQTLRETIQNDDPDVGKVSIACSGSFAMLLYPHLLPLMRDAPRLMMRLEATPQDDILRGVLTRRFDLGIVGRKPDHPRLDAIRLGEEQLCLLLPARDAPEQITFKDLEARGFVAHPDGFAYADELFAFNFPDDFKGSDRLHVRAFVNQISQIPAPVAHGIGYTLLPRSGVEAFPRREDLRIAPLIKTRRHELWLTFERGRRMPARLARISDVIMAVAKTLEPE
ncbi:LysR family transcriptional regulator [Pelagibius litoralis]|uniref:LysR family transcriptional regulator n=1 Tax=Pelagibius litoralis TaxID=374515 RepID=A0A967C8E8_9PROT|nr:LysR family transcriptional regulator [Pelagibius litoralis]NIA68637.1 LysR family transcriptional regulator [Pelagibius litoralis]